MCPDAVDVCCATAGKGVCPLAQWRCGTRSFHEAAPVLKDGLVVGEQGGLDAIEGDGFFAGQRPRGWGGGGVVVREEGGVALVGGPGASDGVHVDLSSPAARRAAQRASCSRHQRPSWRVVSSPGSA